MNEEEKNAIKFFQKLEFDEYEWWYSGEEYETREDIEKVFEKAQKIILNLIDKQQEKLVKFQEHIDNQEKEIERLKNYSELYYLECEKYENFISKDIIKQKIKILENINDSLKFVENRGYEPENYIINSNKYIINFLNNILEGGAK